MANCVFCNSEYDRIAENEVAIAIFDAFPVNPGHALIIPKRHVADFFELSESERNACFALVAEVKSILDSMHKPDGYNIGINVGKAAGQTVFHVHIHLIPRYTGDVGSPRGGVRGVIPSKQSY